jgi:hypothetical protein
MIGDRLAGRLRAVVLGAAADLDCDREIARELDRSRAWTRATIALQRRRR